MTKFFPLVSDIVNKEAEMDRLLRESNLMADLADGKLEAGEDLEKVEPLREKSKELFQEYLEVKKEFEEMQTKQAMNLIDQLQDLNY